MSTATLSRPTRAWIENQPAALDMIRTESVSIAVWQREAPAIASDLMRVPAQDIRFTSPLASLPVRLARALHEAGYAASAARFAIEADILLLADRFCRIMNLDAADIRIERITDNACRKFHADYVTARLLTTYVGCGTQWLDTEQDSDCGCGGPHGFHQLSAGDVAILKGRLWDNAHAAIHRSPPIEGTGAERLLLVINPPQPDDD